MTQCAQCQATARNPICGAYSFSCVHCCVRLVESTRPDKTRAAAMLAAIARFKGSPPRSVIVGLLSARTSARP